MHVGSKLILGLNLLAMLYIAVSFDKCHYSHNKCVALSAQDADENAIPFGG